MSAIAIIDLALRIVENIWPKLADMAKTGEITAAEQEALKARIDKLRDTSLSFSGPEWEIKP